MTEAVADILDKVRRLVAGEVIEIRPGIKAWKSGPLLTMKLTTTLDGITKIRFEPPINGSVKWLLLSLSRKVTGASITPGGYLTLEIDGFPDYGLQL